MRYSLLSLMLLAAIVFTAISVSNAWVQSKTPLGRKPMYQLASSTQENIEATSTENQVSLPWDYQVPDDAVVVIKPSAMKRLRELRDQQHVDPLILRMVRTDD
jgi:hypothetical protein